MERTARQQNNNFRSPSRCRSGRGGRTTGLATPGFAAVSAANASTAATTVAATTTKSSTKKSGHSRDLVEAVFALQELSRSEAAGACESSPAQYPSQDATETETTSTATATVTARATGKEMMITRRRLGNVTALKRFYVPLDLASTFMPPLPPFRVIEKSGRRGGRGGSEVEEEGGEESGGAGGEGAALAAAAAAAAAAATAAAAAAVTAGSRSAASSARGCHCHSNGSC